MPRKKRGKVDDDDERGEDDDDYDDDYEMEDIEKSLDDPLPSLVGKVQSDVFSNSSE